MYDLAVEACWITWKQLGNEAVDKFMLLVYVRLAFYKLSGDHRPHPSAGQRS